MTMTASIRRAAIVNPKGLAIANGDDKRTWPEFAHRVAAMASGLREQGLQPGQHVATLFLNSSAYLEVMMAVWWAGGVLVPINTRLAWEEIRFILEHADTSLFVTDDSFAETAQRAKASIPGLKAVICVDEATRSQLVTHVPMESVEPVLTSMAGIFYTGGTTGTPKGVVLTHQNFLVTALNQERELRMEAGSVYLHTSPMFHLAGFGTMLGMILAGGAHSFVDRFSPETFYERLRSDGVTHAMLVPSMLTMVLDSAVRDDALLKQIRAIAYGAAPISQALLSRVLDAFPNVRLTQFYGMTEVCGASTRLAPERHVLNGPLSGKLGSVGQALETFEVRIARPDGGTCMPGETGEVQMRGPAVMVGYWKAPDKTAETLIDGWLRSGDVGRMDEDGFIYLVDRLKDMIISGGENVYSVEVENALSQHPAVASCAVIGVTDEKWGERVHAVIVKRPGVEVGTDDLVAHCRTLIAGYKCPRSFDFREALPVSGVGKVLKAELRKSFATEPEHQVS